MRTLIWVEEGGDFHAFISYRWSDNREFAKALQASLHAFKRPWYGLRGLRIFRDLNNLPAEVDLWDEIAKRLDRSEYLLILISPGIARAGGGVEREVGLWLNKPERAKRILFVLTHGAANDWADIRSMLPASLHEHLSAAPVFADIRDLRQQMISKPRSPETRERAWDRLRQVLLALHHKEDWGVLHGEESALRRDTLRVVVATIFILLAVVAYGAWATRRIIADRDAASSTAADLWSRSADQAFERGDELKALLYASKAVEAAPSNDRRREAFVSRVVHLARRAPEVAATLGTGRLLRTVAGRTEANFSPSRRQVATIAADLRIELWDLPSGAQQLDPMNAAAITYRAFRSPVFSPDGLLVAAEIDISEGKPFPRREVWLWEGETSKLRFRWVVGHELGNLNGVRFASDSRTLFAISYEAIAGWDVGTGMKIEPILGSFDFDCKRSGQWLLTSAPAPPIGATHKISSLDTWSRTEIASIEIRGEIAGIVCSERGTIAFELCESLDERGEPIPPCSLMTWDPWTDERRNFELGDVGRVEDWNESEDVLLLRIPPSDNPFEAGLAFFALNSGSWIFPSLPVDIKIDRAWLGTNGRTGFVLSLDGELFTFASDSGLVLDRRRIGDRNDPLGRLLDDREHLGMVSIDGTVRIWQAWTPSETELSAVPVHTPRMLDRAAFFDSGRHLLSTFCDSKGSCTFPNRIEVKDIISSATISPDLSPSTINTFFRTGADLLLINAWSRSGAPGFDFKTMRISDGLIVPNPFPRSIAIQPSDLLGIEVTGTGSGIAATASGRGFDIISWRPGEDSPPRRPMNGSFLGFASNGAYFASTEESEFDRREFRDLRFYDSQTLEPVSDTFRFVDPRLVRLTILLLRQTEKIEIVDRNIVVLEGALGEIARLHGGQGAFLTGPNGDMLRVPRYFPDRIEKQDPGTTPTELVVSFDGRWLISNGVLSEASTGLPITFLPGDEQRPLATTFEADSYSVLTMTSDGDLRRSKVIYPDDPIWAEAGPALTGLAASTEQDLERIDQRRLLELREQFCEHPAVKSAGVRCLTETRGASLRQQCSADNLWSKECSTIF